ncbi:uncharacterized protein Z519_01828 [Cladophialophora bantiana CBS 173.52]|uniref:Major facilitator superfamily (MFS) profile domain-containing protein n=1 Tax=Cladophialophora bantiana (strain ATCC 10958 / CBS 173.52 / CDC B-1940 / NIH 8579) TaxID=1442370 RepID=A0A0D2IN71_CLAB1|nr:uncharacterized protein Z519_01828 [Cladophialophora bantiana CBS 173.52]KIW98244.1 hypothetical protein Z519_01828 [Cladophialophora bantiana CBS 173.52]
METLEERPQRHYKTSAILYASGVSFGAASYGFASSIISTTIGQPTFLESMKLERASNASEILGASNALFFVGGIIGSVLVSVIADRYGRRPAIAIGATMILFSSALAAASQHIAMFIIFRFINGIGGYMALTTVPLWITESVPPKDRGILSDINPIFNNIGYNAASWVGVGFFFYKGSNAWRGPLAIGCLFPILCLVSLWFVPESPRYLLSKDRAEEAWKIVRSLHTRNGDESFARREFQQMQSQIAFDRALNVGWLGMLRRPSYRKRALMAFFLVFILVSSGILVVGNYGTIIYSQLGYGTEAQLFLQAGFLGTAFVSNILAVLVVDRMPRPTLICLGLVGCMASLTCEAALVATYVNSENKSGLSACVAMLYLYVFCYGLLLDGVTWWYASEIFPTHLRAHGMSIAMGTYALVNIIWLQAAPTAFENIGWKYYLFFIVITTIGAVIIWSTFPDTLNLSLEEVARLFGDDDLVEAYELHSGTAEENKKHELIAKVQGISLHKRCTN